MIHIVPGPHHHLEGWDQLAAGGTVSCGAEEPAESMVQRAQEPARELGVRKLQGSSSTSGTTCLPSLWGLAGKPRQEDGSVVRSTDSRI